MLTNTTYDLIDFVIIIYQDLVLYRSLKILFNNLILIT